MGISTLFKVIGVASVCILGLYTILKGNKKKETMADNNEQRLTLESKMDRIIEWVKTCDTKASIMLTLLCLILSIIFTSDFVVNGFSKILQSLRLYYDSTGKNDIHDISITGLLAFVSMVLFLYFTLGSGYRFVMVLYSKIQENQIEDGLKKRIYNFLNWLFVYKPSNKETSDAYLNSLIHFHNIANFNSFSDYKNATDNQEYDEVEDLHSQIYINANRCTEKFNDYNAAIRWMLYSVPFLLPLYICLSLFLTYRT